MTDGPEWFAPKRYGYGAGPENGRPLRETKRGFWAIDDKYPALTPAQQIRIDATPAPATQKTNLLTPLTSSEAP